MKKIILIIMLISGSLFGQNWYSATIDSNATTSSIIRLGTDRPTALVITGTLIGTHISFLGAIDDTKDFFSVVDSSGSAVSYPIADSTFFVLPKIFDGLNTFKIVSDSTETATDILIEVRGENLTGEKK